MSTSSTKFGSSGKKDKRDAASTPQVATTEVSEQTWRFAAICIFVIAAFLRLYHLTLVPLHHDEGVNGNFLVHLVRDGVYRYDPENYHGPTLYYFAAFIPWVFQFLFGVSARETYGLTTVTIRLIPALFGLGTIALVLTLRRYVGSIAALSAALLLAISPGAVYLSRYFIHETLFVFFTLGIVVASLKFYREKNGWYLLVAAGSAALLFATKETALISAGVLLIALVITPVYMRMFAKPNRQTKGKRTPAPERRSLRQVIDELGGPTNVVVWSALAFLVFMALNVLFYSSFFKNYPKGIYDAVRTLEFWTKTGKEAHVHPLLTYFKWLFWQESSLLLLGALGAAFAVLRPKRSVPLFCSLWAFGLIAAYSLVPYKTPWLALNFVVPLAIVSGYALQSVYEHSNGQLRLPIVILSAAAIVSTYQCVDLNFVNYDNDDTYYVYVYAHTRRQTKDLLAEIDRTAQAHQGGQTGITIVSPDYWPLPWYLRNYSRVGYYARLTPTTEPIVIASETQRKDVEAMLGPNYHLVPSGTPEGTFALRPGVDLLLYVRQTP